MQLFLWVFMSLFLAWEFGRVDHNDNKADSPSASASQLVEPPNLPLKEVSSRCPSLDNDKQVLE